MLGSCGLDPKAVIGSTRREAEGWWFPFIPAIYCTQRPRKRYLMPLRSLLQGILFLLTNKWILSYLLQGSVSVCPLETYPL